MVLVFHDFVLGSGQFKLCDLCIGNVKIGYCV